MTVNSLSTSTSPAKTTSVEAPPNESRFSAIGRIFSIRGTKFGPDDSSEQFLQKLACLALDEMLPLLCLLTPDGIVLECNRAFLERSGLTRTEAVGKPIWETTWWTSKPEVDLREAVGQAVDGESIGYSVEVHAKEDGETAVAMELTLCPVKDDTDRIVFLLLEGRDVARPILHEDETDQQRKELSWLNEEGFRTVMEATSECVKLVAKDGTLLHINSVGLALIDAQSIDIVKGKNVFDLIAPEDRDRYQRFHEKICAGEKGSMEMDIIGLNGLRRRVETRAVPLRISDGTLTHLAVTRDITERRLAQETSQRLSAIVSSSDDAIVSKNLDGIVTSWNSAAEKMFGYTAKEIIGKPITTIIPAELRDDEIRILQTIASGKRIEHFETVRLTKSGERIDVSLTVSPLKDETGKIVGAAKIARNITQHKKAERALRTAEKLASVGRLAATVAHEINNPLEALTNLIYLARNATSRDDASKYLSAAEEELERVSQLTKQTLGFYRETKGRNATQVGSIATSLLSVFSSRMRNKGIHVRTDIRQDPEIYAIPGEIRQLIANLLSNSFDAVENGGLIQIRVSAATLWKQKRKGVRLTVADNGSGISKEVRSQLFEPFFTTKKDIGTGLGLWVCRSIIQKHSGVIQVKSSVEAGKSWTVFSVLLPLDPEQSNNDDISQEAD